MTWFRRSAPFALSAALLVPLAAQTHVQPSPPFRFELASIGPSRPDNPNSNFNLNEGQVTAENINLLFLIKEAYGLNIGSDDQIVGAPGWLRTTSFDIKTRIDDATAKAMKQMRPEEQKAAIDEMLRNLMEHRFHLKVRTDNQPRTVDALVVTKGGSKLQPFTGCHPSADHGCEPSEWQGLRNDGHGHVQGKGATTAMLANILALQPDVGGRTVVDNTGLKGEYSFDLHYTPDNAAAETSGPSLFSALQEQLGLKLETKKLPIKVLTIERVDPPSPD